MDSFVSKSFWPIIIGNIMHIPFLIIFFGGMDIDSSVWWKDILTVFTKLDRNIKRIIKNSQDNFITKQRIFFSYY